MGVKCLVIASYYLHRIEVLSYWRPIAMASLAFARIQPIAAGPLWTRHLDSRQYLLVSRRPRPGILVFQAHSIFQRLSLRDPRRPSRLSLPASPTPSAVSGPSTCPIHVPEISRLRADHEIPSSQAYHPSQWSQKYLLHVSTRLPYAPHLESDFPILCLPTHQGRDRQYRLNQRV